MRSEPESLGLRGLGLCGHLEFYTREFYPVIPSDVMVFPSCPPVTSAGTGTVGGSGLAVPPVFLSPELTRRRSSADRRREILGRRIQSSWGLGSTRRWGRSPGWSGLEELS